MPRKFEEPFPPDSDGMFYDPEQREQPQPQNGNGKHARSPIHYEWEPVDTNVRWFVKNRMREVGVGALISQGHKGKTQALNSLAGQTIIGGEWGGQHIKRPGGVIYFAAEDGDGVRQSWRAVKDLVLRPHYEHVGEPMPEQFPFADVIEECPLLLPGGERAIKWYIERIEEAKAVFRSKFDCELPLAIFETLSKLSGFKNENDNSECTRAFMALERIALSCGLFCLISDHLPKDEAATKPRGGVAKFDSADSILRISVPGETDGRILHVDKARGCGSAGQEVPFRLMKVARGIDADGDEVTDIRVAWDDQSQARRGRPPKRRHDLLIAMDDAFDAGLGRRISVPHRGTFFAVPQEPWRQNYFRRVRLVGMTEKSLNDTFTRAVRQLRKENVIDTHSFETEGDFVFRIDGDEKRHLATE